MKPPAVLLIFRYKCKLKEWCNTDLYIKPTDGLQYLHCQSSHPLHIKTSIPYSEALGLAGVAHQKMILKHMFLV